jgi:hypothetical protein
MEEFNENDFIQANTNTATGKLTIELTFSSHSKSSSFGFNLISIPKPYYNDFFEAINVLKGRMISVGEEWKYNELTKNDWRRIYQDHIKGGIIEEMDLDYFKKTYNQFINGMKSNEDGHQIAKPLRQQILGMREYNLADTKDQFSNKYEISEEMITNFCPLDIENIITAYRYKSDDYYFDDSKKYYGLFIHF